MPAPRQAYASRALSQLPRLLGNQDRNIFSPTYGCFHRDYWLDKTSDFADAVRQFGVHSLALVYTHDFPGNIYKGKEKIRDWAVAGMKFWVAIQHADGSFDEFYPYERGWVGPSAFTAFTVIEALQLLQGEMAQGDIDLVTSAVRRTAQFIAKGESEEDHLANHHAMACLAVWKAARLLDDDTLRKGYERLFEGFLRYHNADEGWSREYDGVDPGYLSATVSFLGKVYQDNRESAILDVVRKSIEFCSYFAYPNGFYAGSLGSRNTLHFYPHGFEIFAGEVPMAASVAEKMLAGLDEGALVPPEIISDRYVFYRVPEFLQSYLDYTPRRDSLPPLPWERESFNAWFPGARIWARKTGHTWCIANCAKGGVVKVFDTNTRKLVLNDCGLIGELADGRVATTQWIDPAYQVEADENGFTVKGKMNLVPSNKLFTPFKNIVFRTVMAVFGRVPALAHAIKGRIRKTLMLGQRRTAVVFERKVLIQEGGIQLADVIQLKGSETFKRLAAGDEFFVRYVPQSRYFQSQELDIAGRELNVEQIRSLNVEKTVSLSTEARA